MNKFFINLVVEDVVTETIARKLLYEKFSKIQVKSIFTKRGCGGIDKNLSAYNNASKQIPFLVLRDLDQVECAPKLKVRLVNFVPHQNFLFRIVQREIEAWVLADPDSIKNFFSIKSLRVPKPTDDIPNPKEYLLNIIGKCNQKRLKEEMLPGPQSTANIGPNYNFYLQNLIDKNWSIDRAIENSKSLQKTIESIDNLLSCLL